MISTMAESTCLTCVLLEFTTVGEKGCPTFVKGAFCLLFVFVVLIIFSG